MAFKHIREASLAQKWRFLKGNQAYRKAPLRTLARLLLWRLHCALKHPAHVRLDRWGASCLVPAQWRGISKLLYAFGEDYEPELIFLEKLLFRGGVFVDIGACFGVYTLAGSRIVGAEGKVIAFEPGTKAFSVLQANIRINNFTNVTAFRLALADRKTMLKLYHHPDASRNSLGTTEESAEYEEVQSQTLDATLHEAGVSHVDLIKMDVEGAEELVLRGGKRLARFKPSNNHFRN